MTQGYLSNYVQVGTVMLMQRCEWRLPSSSPNDVPKPETKEAGFSPRRRCFDMWCLVLGRCEFSDAIYEPDWKTRWAVVRFPVRPQETQQSRHWCCSTATRFPVYTQRLIWGRSSLVHGWITNICAVIGGYWDRVVCPCDSHVFSRLWRTHTHTSHIWLHFPFDGEVWGIPQAQRCLEKQLQP